MYANWGTLKHTTSGSYDIGEGKKGLMFPFHISIRALSLLRCKAFFMLRNYFALWILGHLILPRKVGFQIILSFSFSIGCKIRFGVKMFELLIFFCLCLLLPVILLSSLPYFCLGNLHQKTASINWQGSNFRAASQMEKNPTFSSIFHNSKNINRLIGDKLSWL